MNLTQEWIKTISSTAKNLTQILEIQIISVNNTGIMEHGWTGVWVSHKKQQLTVQLTSAQNDPRTKILLSKNTIQRFVTALQQRIKSHNTDMQDTDKDK